MIRRTRSILVAVVCFLISTPMRAQWGIHWTFQGESITKAGIFDQFLLGLGCNHDLNDRLSIGLDAVIDTRWSQEGKSVEVLDPGTSGLFSYTERTKVFGFQYRCQYHLSDNGSSSMYLGTTLGVRRVSQTLVYDVFDPSFSFSSDTKLGTGTIIPIGLRLGYRGSMDGGYGDLFVGAAYSIGGDQQLNTGSFVQPNSALAGFNLQVGFSYGIGW